MIVLSKNIYETYITILCSTPGKREVKTSLNESDLWVGKGSETMCGVHGKTGSETIGETFDETNNKRNEKVTLNLLCPQNTMASVIMELWHSKGGEIRVRVST
jgi:hypothetical protein